jgi:hypothetical protein
LAGGWSDERCLPVAASLRLVWQLHTLHLPGGNKFSHLGTVDHIVGSPDIDEFILHLASSAESRAASPARQARGYTCAAA